MPVDGWIIDASVLGSAFFEEVESETARAFVTQAASLKAPALLTIEIASIGAKKIWKGLAEAEVGARAAEATARLVTLVHDASALELEALQLAAEHRFSAYDAAYLALARQEGVPMVTLDDRLKRRADEAGFGEHVVLLSEVKF